ncbi:MAG: glycosyltransferase, partial [Clostridium sp.]|nr:glycosyltransferase [Clostridium sp.]
VQAEAERSGQGNVQAEAERSGQGNVQAEAEPIGQRNAQADTVPTGQEDMQPQAERRMLGYETGQMDTLIAQCEYALSHERETEEIAAAGKRYAESQDTWDHFAKRLIGWIESETKR